MRLEIAPRAHTHDGRAARLLPSLQRAVSPAIRGVSLVDVFLLDGITTLSPATAAEVFCDSVAQELLVDSWCAEQEARRPWDWLVEIAVRPGVTDPVAITAREALSACLPGGLAPGAVVQTAVQYLVAVEPGAVVDPQVLARFFHNPLIQAATCLGSADWAAGRRPPARYPDVAAGKAPRARTL